MFLQEVQWQPLKQNRHFKNILISLGKFIFHKTARFKIIFQAKTSSLVFFSSLIYILKTVIIFCDKPYHKRKIFNINFTFLPSTMMQLGHLKQKGPWEYLFLIKEVVKLFPDYKEILPGYFMITNWHAVWLIVGGFPVLEDTAWCYDNRICIC